MRARRTIRVAIPLAAVAVMLAAASVAWACTNIVGTLTINGYADYPHAVPPNPPPKIYAGASVPNIAVSALPANFAGKSFDIVATATQGQYCMTYKHTLVSGVNASTSSPYGLGPVSATAPSTGIYDVCAVNSSVSPGANSTNPAVLTVS